MSARSPKQRRESPADPPVAPDPSSIEAVVPQGDRRASLVAIRDRLAAETSDTLWNRHKDECHCVCGMGDGRMLVALVKELRAVIAELESIPNGREVSKADELAARRAARLQKTAGL